MVWCTLNFELVVDDPGFEVLSKPILGNMSSV